ncbi:hypothetical protein RHGRI_027605 [Rhododendron griersonianum]|uniref:Uncharacterized protein n=1 Tax=Rhododendron griersonianum TaxID=479676 RepID=A0AAV6J1P3_9ERIC|nr:hypothetical protein RHGRI_027605 [Rhododendron griersonianum]
MASMGDQREEIWTKEEVQQPKKRKQKRKPKLVSWKKFQQKQCGTGEIGETCSQGDIPVTEAGEEEDLEWMACRDKDLPKCSMYLSLKDEKDKTRVMAAAKGAAFLAHASFSCIYWSYLEDVFSEIPDIFEKVKQDVLLALIKFALTIHDLEFFARIAFNENIKAERMKFLQDLDVAPPKTTARAIHDIATGEMDFGNFCLLLERDVGYILAVRGGHLESWERNLEEYVADDYTWEFEDVNMPETLVDATISVMKKISPLKRDCAMHLMMELKNENCCCVLNALVHEFWRDIDVSHLQDSAHVPSTEFNCLLSCILESVTRLVEWRLVELRESMCSVVFPLLFGAFGDCTGDVFDVVMHADCERRWEGKKIIGTRHLLLGLLRSRIAESVRKFGRFRVDSKESSMHRYEVYSVAEYVTVIFGDDDMKLEHLFLAIMVVNHEINDLHNTIKGLSVEEYILVVQERMLGGLDINLGSLDTMAFVGNGIATEGEGETWNASLTSKLVGEFFEGTKKFMDPWSVGGPLSIECKSYELPIIRGNGGEEETEGGKLSIGGCAGEEAWYDHLSLCKESESFAI